ncbi:hypothetical protein KAR28_06750 [Candidatus Parcubacteria bacterium]|nr:hypothetical protein [Candidatus Parcubacteria bacterium]
MQRQPSAPFVGFDKFVVGKAAKLKADLIKRLKVMMEGNEPSSGQLILGENGNGKTLVNKSLQAFASDLNLKTMKDGGLPSFDIMFSRVSFHQISSSNVGVELAKNLRRSYVEPTDITYSSIAATTLKQFAEQYNPHWSLKIFSAPAKIALNYSIKKYENYIKDIIEVSSQQAVSPGVDIVFKKIDDRLRFLGLHKAFGKYARSNKLSVFLESYIGDDKQNYRSVEELNKALHDDLAASFGRGQPHDVVVAISEMCKSVGCKVLVLEIDDCNDSESIDFLLPIAENFEKYTNPKIFVIASGVTKCWDVNIVNGFDKSAQHKVQEYFNRTELEKPTGEDIEALSEKLETLIQTEEAENGKSLSWDINTKKQAISHCDGKSFRQATKILIDSAEPFIR